MLTEKTESMSIVDHETESVFLLESSDLVEDTESTGHTIYTLSDEEHSAAVGISLSAGTCKNLLAIFDIVMTIFVFASYVETDTVEKTCMALCIVNDNVVTGCKSIDGGHDSLITEVIEESIFLLLELCEHFLKFLVISGVA